MEQKLGYIQNIVGINKMKKTKIKSTRGEQYVAIWVKIPTHLRLKKYAVNLQATFDETINLVLNKVEK